MIRTVELGLPAYSKVIPQAAAEVLRPLMTLAGEFHHRSDSHISAQGLVGQRLLCASFFLSSKDLDEQEKTLMTLVLCIL